MFKSCSRCGKIHNQGYKCTHNKPKYDNAKYKTAEDNLRNTAAWKKKSKEIKRASKYLCEVCIDNGAYTYDNLAVHHINRLRGAPEKFLDNYNLVSLCKLHHKMADNGELTIEYLEKLARSREGRDTPLVEGS